MTKHEGQKPNEARSRFGLWPSCLVISAIAVMAGGCTGYTEKFSKFSNDGSLAHTVTVRHWTFLTSSEAARLKTETQTEDFIRNVNADGLRSKPDSEAIKATTEGIAKGVVEGLKITGGIP